jgi:hypothetical protein
VTSESSESPDAESPDAVFPESFVESFPESFVESSESSESSVVVSESAFPESSFAESDTLNAL